MSEEIPSELMLELVLNALPVRLFWKSRDGVFLGANQSFAEDSGAPTPASIVGKTDYDFYERGFAEAFRADDRAIMESGEARLDKLEENRLAGGETSRWYSTNKIPLRDSAGQVIGVLGTYQDVTERVQLSRERARLIEELSAARMAAERASAAKSEFLASMSHELRTPLNAIIGFSEMLREGADEQSRASDVNDLDRVLRAAKHLLRLIDTLLDLSKIDAGKMQITIDEFGVADAAASAIDMVRVRAAARGNALKLDLSDDLGVARNDSFKLSQCLLNLLSNAVKFTNSGAVTLSVRREADLIRFDVIDTGLGIDAEVLPHLFEPYAQANSSVTRSFGGTGLGLAITRQLARLMGGDVTVKSALGQGSTFSLTIAADHAAHAKAA